MYKNYFYNTTIYDLVNKFRYVSNNQIPLIKKIVLTIPIENQSQRTILSVALLLKLFSGSDLKFSKKKKTKFFFKLKKGEIASCQVILSKNYYEFFFFRLIYNALPENKATAIVSLKNINFVSLNLDKNFFFQELEMFFAFFKDVSKINLSLIFKSNNVKEIIVLLNSIKVKSKIK